MDQRCDKRLGLYSDSGVLSRLINTDQMFSSWNGEGRGAGRKTRNRRPVWWGNNLPNNVAAGLDPVVQEGETCVGDKIGEAHICGGIGLIYEVWGGGWEIMTVRSFRGSRLRSGKLKPCGGWHRRAKSASCTCFRISHALHPRPGIHCKTRVTTIVALIAATFFGTDSHSQYKPVSTISPSLRCCGSRELFNLVEHCRIFVQLRQCLCPRAAHLDIIMHFPSRRH
jgi:hypothetical protein